jgi:uncharacterized membrane protein
VTPASGTQEGGAGDERGKAMDRIVAFSDGVFAFAITLLVVTLDVPEIPSNLVGRELTSALLAQLPRFAAYAFSFLIVAVYWIAHHRMFRYIIRYDVRLLQLNLLMLFGVAFLPYPVELLGRYGDQPVAVVMWGLTMGLVGSLSTAIWVYAARHDMLAAGVSREMVSHLAWRAATPPAVFLVLAAIGFFEPQAAYYVWILIPLIHGYLRRRFGEEGVR